MADDEQDVCRNDSSDECNESVISPQEMAIKQDGKQEGRDPKTGQFVAGWKGGGRKKGSKDKLNMQVIGTLEKLWEQRGEEIMQHLAAEKPEVLAGLVAKLIPQSLAAEAITGEAEKAQGNQEVTIKVVTDQSRDVLPPREVQGELVYDDNVH